MAFDGLSSRLQMALRRVTGRGSLTEKDIDEMLREVRLSLLEADVNYRVVKEFLANIKVAATGEKIMKGLNPGQQVVKIVRDELKRVLGEETQEIKFKINSPKASLSINTFILSKLISILYLFIWLDKYNSAFAICT